MSVRLPVINIRALSAHEQIYEAYLRRYNIQGRRLSENVLELVQQELNTEDNPRQLNFQGNWHAEIDQCSREVVNFLIFLNRASSQPRSNVISRIVHYIYRLERWEKQTGASEFLHGSLTELVRHLRTFNQPQEQPHASNQNPQFPISQNSNTHISSSNSSNLNNPGVNIPHITVTQPTPERSNGNPQEIPNVFSSTQNLHGDNAPRPPGILHHVHTNAQHRTFPQNVANPIQHEYIRPQAHSFAAVPSHIRVDPAHISVLARMPTPPLVTAADATQIFEYQNDNQLRIPQSTVNQSHRGTSTPSGMNVSRVTVASHVNNESLHENNNRPQNVDFQFRNNNSQVNSQQINRQRPYNIHANSGLHANNVESIHYPSQTQWNTINNASYVPTQNSNYMPTQNQISGLAEQLIQGLTPAVNSIIGAIGNYTVRRDNEAFTAQHLNLLKANCTFGHDNKQTAQEYLLNLRNFMEDQGVDGREIMKYITYTLYGVARSWYNTLHRGISIGDYMLAFEKRFCKQREKIDVVFDLIEEKMSNSDDVHQHIDKILTVVNTYDLKMTGEEQLKLVSRTLPEKMVRMIKLRGIKTVQELIDFLLIMYPVETVDRREIRKRVSVIENLDNDLFDSSQICSTSEYEVVNEESDSDQSVYAMDRSGKHFRKVPTRKSDYQSNPNKTHHNQNANRISSNQKNTSNGDSSYQTAPQQKINYIEECVCFKCGNFGHSAANCRKASARIVCYYCGRPDVISTECPSRVCIDRRDKKLNEPLQSESKNESVDLISK